MINDQMLENDRIMLTRCTSIIQAVSQHLISKHWQLATAESCTGGWLAKICTDFEGSSAWFDGGVLCYSNHFKREFLNVPHVLMEAHGAVSQPVVEKMVQGLLLRTQSNIGVAISGIAGPTGGTDQKPVGTVHFAWRLFDGTMFTRQALFQGNRNAVRMQAVYYALSGVQQLLALNEKQARDAQAEQTNQGQ